MNPSRYFIPPMGRMPRMYPNNLSISNIINKLGNGIKSFNWKGMLNGVNKTLNVVNQTIPLVKQAKPMYDNVKSMLLITKTFRNETQNNNKQKKSFNKNHSMNNTIIKEKKDNINNPIFFI